MPVKFPPGRAWLATKPKSIGSVIAADTMGIVDVAFWAAIAADVLAVTIMLGLS
jgi:hypothetical protein